MAGATFSRAAENPAAYAGLHKKVQGLFLETLAWAPVMQLQYLGCTTTQACIFADRHSFVTAAFLQAVATSWKSLLQLA